MNDEMAKDVTRMMKSLHGESHVAITSEALDQFVAKAVGLPFYDKRGGKNDLIGYVVEAWRDSDHAMARIKTHDGVEFEAIVMKVTR